MHNRLNVPYCHTKGIKFDHIRHKVALMALFEILKLHFVNISNIEASTRNTTPYHACVISCVQFCSVQAYTSYGTK